MTDLELLLIVVGMGAVLLAALSVYIEQTTRPDEPAHRDVLRREPRYREHRRRRR